MVWSLPTQTFLLRTELALVCFSTKVVHLDERTAKHLEHAERLFGEIDTSNSGFVEVNELKVCALHSTRWHVACLTRVVRRCRLS